MVYLCEDETFENVLARLPYFIDEVHNSEESSGEWILTNDLRAV